MKHRNFIFTFVIAIFLIVSGCASTPPSTMPTKQEIANADYGKYPDNYKKIIQDYMGCYKVPHLSCYYLDWSTPTKAYDYNKSSTVFGYGVCVTIQLHKEESNSLQHSTGPHYFLINNNHIVSYYTHADSSGRITNKEIPLGGLSCIRQ